MIGKITKGSGFGGVLGYALEKEGAEFLDTNCIADPADPSALAQEMAEHAARERPNLAKPVLHVALSAAPGEHLTDEQWRAVSDAYREKMGLSNTQYVLVRHTDTVHDHVHLIINRVDFAGRTLTDSHDYVRQEAVLDAIEQQFGLTRVREKMRAAIRENPPLALDNLLSKRSRINENQLRRQVARYFYDPAERERIVEAVLRDPRTIYLGRDDNGRNLYTTREVIAEREAIRKDIEILAERRVPTQHVAPIAEPPDGFKLSEEQQIAVDAVTSERGIVTITGYAGVGKTTLMAEAMREWRAQGKDVLGCALAGSAASQLQGEAGITSRTITATLRQLESGALTMSPDTVLLIDEGAMADNKQLRALLHHAVEAGAVVRFAGDREQLQSIERGGAFDMAREIGGEITVTAVRRQADTVDDLGNVLVDRSWMRDATRAFGDGRTADAVKAYLDHDCVEWSHSRSSARDSMVARYLEAVDSGRETKDMLAMAHTRDDVAALNTQIRAGLKDRGALGEEHTYTVTRTIEDTFGNKHEVIGTLALAAGERIVLTKNEYKNLDVRNGQFGIVLSTTPDDFKVKMDDGRELYINVSEYGNIQHGYAATVHKSQGASIKETFELASSGMDSHMAYVALTRHKENTTLFASRNEFARDADLIETLSRRPEPDGLDLDDTDTADLESSYDAAKRDLGAATWAAPHVESINQAHLFRHAAEATRIGADALRLLPGSDLARAAGSGLGGSLHDLPRRIEYVEHNRAMRGLSDDSGRREQTASRSRDMSAPSSATRAFAYWHTADPTRYTLEERDGQLVGVDHTANTEAVLTDSAGKPLPASAREDVEIQGELDHADLWHGAEQDAEAEEALGKGRELSL